MESSTFINARYWDGATVRPLADVVRAERERQRDQRREGTADFGVEAAGWLERRLARETLYAPRATVGPGNVLSGQWSSLSVAASGRRLGGLLIRRPFGRRTRSVRALVCAKGFPFGAVVLGSSVATTQADPVLELGVRLSPLVELTTQRMQLKVVANTECATVKAMWLDS